MGENVTMIEAVSDLLPGIMMLNVVVLIHLAGHYFCARLFGISVDEVSFGLGPRLFGFSRLNVNYRICWLPVGGYVKTKTDIDNEGPNGKKIGVILSGPAVSFLFYIFVFSASLAVIGLPSIRSGGVVFIPLSFGDSLFETGRFVTEFIFGGRSNDLEKLLMFYPYVSLRLLCVGAIWSMKLGLLNLLPLPLLDGWRALGAVLAVFTHPEKARKIRPWVAILLMVFFALILLLPDLKHSGFLWGFLVGRG